MASGAHRGEKLQAASYVGLLDETVGLNAKQKRASLERSESPTVAIGGRPCCRQAPAKFALENIEWSAVLLGNLSH